MKGYTHPRRSPNLDDFAVKLDLWTALRALLGTLGEVFPERQHGMALDEVVPADAGRAGHLHGTCRLLPALLIRSTRWLSPEHEPETLSILARCWRFRCTWQTGYKGKKGGGAEGVGGTSKGEKGPKGATNGSCWNLQCRGL